MDLAQKPVYKLDLAAGTSVVNLTTPLVEGDDRAQTFTLELTDKGTPANLNGYSVTAYFGRGKTAEDEADTVPLSGTVSGNVATITLTESCYSRSCYFSMPIRLSNGATGQKRTYLIVRGTVVKSVDGKIIDPDGSVPSLDDLFAQIAVMERSRQAAEEATEEALAAAARADEARKGIQGDLAALTEDIAELGDGYIAITAPLANETGCDWNLNDVSYTAGAITPKLESNGILRIDFAEDIRGIGLLLYVMTATSGKSQQYEVNELTITEASYTFEITDTCRVMIAASAGMAHYFDMVQAGTSIYTLTTESNFRRLQNQIVGNQKIWCFGDSLTKGVITGTTAIEQSYPYWLGKFLGNDAVEISNFGVPGASVQDMLAAVQEKDFYDNCDIAILMIGTNSFITNGSPDDPTSNIGAYHAAIKHIIDSGKGMTKIVLMNPPKSYRESVPDRWNDEMHYTIQQIAHEYGLDCIDLYKFLPFTPDDTVYYSDDKVHFTGKGYYYIAYIVYNYLVNHMTASQIGGSPTFDY